MAANTLIIKQATLSVMIFIFYRDRLAFNTVHIRCYLHTTCWRISMNRCSKCSLLSWYSECINFCCFVVKHDIFFLCQIRVNVFVFIQYNQCQTYFIVFIINLNTFLYIKKYFSLNLFDSGFSYKYFCTQFIRIKYIKYLKNQQTFKDF